MRSLLSAGLVSLWAAFATVVPMQSAGAPFTIVLGIAQDGGVPQIGNPDHPAWKEPSLRRHVASLALVDPASGRRWLFDATPDIKEQLHRLDEVAPGAGPSPRLAGVFLTHAHMGHYTGLLQLGHEGLGASALPVFAMPRMADFLRTNGPWDQLIRYENIVPRPLAAGRPLELGRELRVTAIPVPHRQEYSEVAAFRIEGPNRSVLYLPDIDSWEAWDASGTSIEAQLAAVDVAYVDGTFFADGEIPGRDMSGFPHPFISHTLRRLAPLPATERAKVRFIHLNHTNAALREGTPQRRAVEEAGMGIATELELVELD